MTFRLQALLSLQDKRLFFANVSYNQILGNNLENEYWKSLFSVNYQSKIDSSLFHTGTYFTRQSGKKRM